jgi:hypothetical protein
MAIDSVSSATVTPPQARAELTRQAEQTNQASQANQASQTRQAAEPQEGERVSRDNESAESRAPQPVVNAQGQVTGQVINTIA